MCFSATASFVAGGALSVTGVVLVARAKTKRELPLASIPLLFGVQQLIEGVVWLSFGTPALNAAATYAYALFSHVLWPIFIPCAVLVLETDSARKTMLRVSSLVGLSVGLHFLYFILTDPLTAHIVNNSIAYRSPHPYPLISTVLYLLATCGSCLVSRHKIIKLFGAALLISYAMAGWFFTETFFSVWCFFAAILSGIIYWHFRRESLSEKKRGVPA